MERIKLIIVRVMLSSIFMVCLLTSYAFCDDQPVPNFVQVITTKRANLYSEIKQQMHTYLDSELSEEVLRQVFKEKTKKYGDPVFIEKYMYGSLSRDVPNKYAERLSDRMMTYAHSFIWVHRDFSCGLIGLNKHDHRVTKTDELSGVISFTAEYSTECKNQGRESYSYPIKATLEFDMKYLASDDQTIFTMTKLNTSPGRLLWKAITDFNKNELIRVLSNVENIYPTPEYIELRSEIIKEAKERLNRRYVWTQGVFSFEKTYNAKLDIAISRLQRALTNFKFSKDDSSFQLIENDQFEYGINNYKPTRNITIKLFPEENNRVVAVFNMQYENLHDSLKNTYVYDEEQLKAKFDSVIDQVSKSIVSGAGKSHATKTAIKDLISG